MSDKIKMRRGELPDLPDLDAGEFGLATDVNSVYIGNPDGDGNILVNPVKEYLDGYSIDGYLVPAVDNSHGLGSPSLRWNNIVVGPGSIHIRSLPGEISAGEKNWNIGIDDAGRLSFNSDGYTAYLITPTGAEVVSGTIFSASDGSASGPAYSFSSGGAAGLYQSGTNEISISTSALQRFVIDSSGNVGVSLSVPNEALTVNGVISLQKTTAPSATDGYGKLYVQSDGDLYYKNSSGVQTNLLGGVLSEQGADGYIAFFTGSNAIAGDNDLFYNRATGDVTVSGGGSLSVTQVKNSSGVLNLGTSASTSHSLSANADVIVGGKLEIDGNAYLDSAVDIAGNAGISSTLEVDGYTWLNGGLGVTGDAGISGTLDAHGVSYFYSPIIISTSWGDEYGRQRASQDDGVIYAISNIYRQANNNLIFTTLPNATKDHNHNSLSANPTIFIHSAIGPDVDDTQWLSLSHNQTDGYISSGTGAIEIGSNLGIDRSPSVYKLEVQGAAAKTDGGTSWATISDITEKKDVVRLSELYDPLDRLTKLSSVVYKWKTPVEHGITEEENILKAGFIAQEVEKYFPEWVKEDNLGKKWLNMVGFEAYVVESIKQIKNLFYEYNNRLTVLEEKLKNNGE